MARGKAIYVALIACGLLVPVAFLARRLSARAGAPELALTTVVSADASDSAGTLSAQGYVVPRRRSRVSPKSAGRVRRVLVSRGAQVAIGDVLLELESENALADLRVFEQELGAARARSGAARAAVLAIDAERLGVSQRADRQHWLLAQGAIPQAESADIDADLVTLARRIDVARAHVSSEEAELRVAQARLEARKLSLKNLELRAPVAGVVMNEPPAPGEYVNPEASVDPAHGFVDIADTSELVIEVEVNESHLRSIKTGAAAEVVLDANSSVNLKGAVLEIAPNVERSRATAAVRIKLFDPVERLLPDMAAHVQIALPASDGERSPSNGRPLIPASTLTNRAGVDSVFVVEGERVRLQKVSVGPATKSGIPLLEGPPLGTLLVANPPPSLSDGQMFTERKSE